MEGLKTSPKKNVVLDFFPFMMIYFEPKQQNIVVTYNWHPKCTRQVVTPAE